MHTYTSPPLLHTLITYRRRRRQQTCIICIYTYAYIYTSRPLLRTLLQHSVKSPHMHIYVRKHKHSAQRTHSNPK